MEAAYESTLRQCKGRSVTTVGADKSLHLRAGPALWLTGGQLLDEVKPVVDSPLEVLQFLLGEVAEASH